MYRMKKILGIFIIVCTILVMLPALPCLAASAKVTMKADNAEVTVGDIINVSITINSAADFGDFEADLTYDKDVLKYVDGAPVITGGSGYLKISDMGNGQLDNSRKYNLKFLALKVGDCSLAFDGEVMVYDEAENAMSVSSDSLDISVKAPVTASTNTNLKNLVTSPVDITPAFDKNVHDYQVNVGNEIQKLIINAIPEDTKANVSISGNDFLKEGENKIVISVLAESGDVIEYTIKVFREAAPTMTPVPTEAVISDDVPFDVVEGDDGTYIVVNAKYKLVEPGEDVVVPEGYTIKDVTISGVTLHAYVPDNNLGSDFILLYAQDSNGNAGFYQYDKVQNTLQRFTGASVDMKKYRSNMNRAGVTIAFLCVLSGLLLIAVIWLFLKNRRGPENEV